MIQLLLFLFLLIDLSLAAPARSWERFAKAHGPGLQAHFDSRGTLVSISSTAPRPGRTTLASRPALRAARDLVAELSPLLGPGFRELDLEHGRAVTDGSSTRVSFEQRRSGRPVRPFGTLAIALDRGGSLIRLDSSLHPPGSVANRIALSESEARSRAGAESAGEGIVWIRTRPGGREPEARHAYEFVSAGFRVVIDAETGQTLSRKDARVY